ncbi:MAG: STAS domain-containing protein, partial [Planctomycetota bacterium]|nr:STAS domain-containing protein [Planctomycetota bacterium]
PQGIRGPLARLVGQGAIEMEVVHEKCGGTCVVRIVGDIGVENSPQLRKKLRALAAEKAGRMAIDLGQVNYMDSSGIATLVECLKNVTGHGGKLCLFNINTTIKDVLEITRLSNLFDIRQTREEALE